MTGNEIETRFKALETEIALLKEKIEKPKVAWWKERIGVFADDPAHEEAMRLGREYRLAQREDYDKADEE